MTSKMSKISPKTSREKGKSNSKEGVNLSPRATPQNGPVTPTQSSAKGGNSLSEELQVTRSQNNNENMETKLEGKQNFIRNPFSSLKREKVAVSQPLEATSLEQDQSKTQKKGFLSIFKWFSKKDTTKRKKTAFEKMKGKGSGSSRSLVSDSSSITFFPIRQSVSADNPNTMIGAFNPSSALKENNSYKDQKRNSLVSISSNVSGSSSVNRSKKRMAPRPPDAGKLENDKLETSHKGSSEGYKKALGESPVASKMKRKAPPPPAASGSEKATAFRPVSTFSNFSSLSQSGSSTLKSSSCSENDSLSLRSDSSQKTASSIPLCKDNKGVLSPKPWYKRKKIKVKEKATSTSKKQKDPYEHWMPEVQYARQSLSSEPQTLNQVPNIETFYDKDIQKGQRFSITSSISDLDRAAVEQLERDKAQKKLAKMDYDRTFYKVSTPHILKQEDLLPNIQVQENSDVSTNNQSATKMNNTYDNLHYNQNGATATCIKSEGCQEQRSFMPVNSLPYASDIPTPCAPDVSLFEENLMQEIYHQYSDSGKINYEEYIEEIRRELEEEATIVGHSDLQSTPMQRAVFDSELFYQLAKDAKMTSEQKRLPLRNEGDSVRTVPATIRNHSIVEPNITTAERSPHCQRIRHPAKNFGLRMNNFFTPDVSIILEGSESVTSSNTTPAEDLSNDLQNFSVSYDQSTDILSQNSEYRATTNDLQDIIESFSIDPQRLNQEEDSDKNNCRSKADKIRDEILLLRERDNFLMWQKTMQETELTREDDEDAIMQRKKKWECNFCTLINQPWRLHCEACGSLRPPNPKRVEADGTPSYGQNGAISHQPVSTSSSLPVTSDDRVSSDMPNYSNTLELGAGLSTATFRISDTENTPGTNWETELQSYFSVFDDQTNVIKNIKSDSLGHNSEEANGYGKIKARNIQPSSKGSGQGALPKESSHSKNGTGISMDMQEIRRARIRKFQLNYSMSHEQPNYCSNQSNDKITDTAEENIGVSNNLNSHETANNYFQESRLNNSPKSDDSSSFQDSRNFYKNKYKKSAVLKQSGAVKSVVSIFNQMNQMKAVQENPPPVKVKNRKISTASILNWGDFERLVSGNSERSENISIRPTSPVVGDIDIASAICKFDEMAAMAEIESLRKPVSKVQTKKFRPETVRNSELSATINSYSSCNGVDTTSEKEGAPKNSITNSIQMRKKLNETNNTINSRVENRDSCDSIIRDGILYTTGESRRRSMSIGSGTFELINPKDFACIEAHHSRRPSPTEEHDVLSLSELAHPLLMPEIGIVASNSTVSASDQNIPKLDQEGSPPNSKKDVEALSRQLVEAEGVADFKASLLKEQPKLDEASSRMLSLLLAQLEEAISNKQHAEAARLARELAKVRVNSIISATFGKNELTSQKAHETKKFRDEPVDKSEADKKQRTKGASAVNEPRAESVVKRTTKVDPTRREVKSDTSHQIQPQDMSFEKDKPFDVEMYVEDKSSHEGPISMTLVPSMTVGELKAKVCEEFGFPVEVQRWILGRLLADDDSKTLWSHKVNTEGCPIFLYLVVPETENKPVSPKLSRSSSAKSKSSQRSEGETPSNNAEAKSPSATRKKYKGSDNSRRKENGNEEIVQKDKMIHKHRQAHSHKELKSSPQLFEKTTSDTSRNDLNGVEDRSSSRGSHPKQNVNEPRGRKPSQNQKIDRIDRSSGLSNSSVPQEKKNITQILISSQEPVPQFSEANDYWVCPQCTLINRKERPGCEACTSERPEMISNSAPKTKNLRQATFALDLQGCVPNLEPFECTICLMHFEIGEGVVLRDCLHVFCRDCLANSVKYSDTARVKCPFRDQSYSCQFSLQDREIKDLLTEEDYKKHLDKSIKEAAGSMRNVFYCKTPDCKGFCQFEDNVNVFVCDVCKKANCLTCQVQHEGLTCKQYQDDLASKQDEETLKTKKFFDDIIRRGDGIPCPQCSIMLVRKWGCDWMRCPMCRTEICWVTQGPRWGPEGQGDTSGGCKCGINGRKCHPKCTYCH